MTVKPIGACDESQLDVLLFGNDDSAAFRAAAEHVELCAVCQRRLTELAGDEHAWSDARRLLAEDDADAPPSREDHAGPVVPVRLQQGIAESAQRIELGFLHPPSHPELLGRLGRYEIERMIGAGGMGIVLKGFDTELNRPVAVKVLAPHLAHNGAARQRFAREGRAAAAVVHEHVVAIHNVESEGEVPFLVMQYVAGESLQARVERQGPLGVCELLRIASQAAAGLAAAHQQGLIHRDIKPANLLLETGVERALLTDFGLARAIDDASLTHTGIVAGTPHYMSPEQADGRTIDHRSDLFSLGSVLYFMATGHPPFRAERPMAVLHRICHSRHRPVRESNPDVPQELSDVIDRLLEKRPSRRPGSAAEVRQLLENLLADIQQGRLRSRVRRRLDAKQLALAGLLASGTVVAASLWMIAWLGRPNSASPRAAAELARPMGPGDASHGGLIPHLLSFGPSEETDFAAAMTEALSVLDRLEKRADTGDSIRLPMISPWRSELQAVGRDLSRLENLVYPELAIRGENQ
ncbi:MAG: serine/threonine protein kinase [Pirellulaceae bacterium]|nr:serine/threonine protein kinase [Pirellulaceae bacterium]